MESNPTTAESEQKLPKNSKENRYYYRHKTEILEKKLQKKLEDPEYRAKYEERQRKKAEKEELERKKSEKRELKKKAIAELLNSDKNPSGVK